MGFRRKINVGGSVGMSELMDMMEQVKALKNGVGIQNILTAAYKILGNPIVMFNTEYNLLSYTEVVTDDPVWNEIITQGTFSMETQEIFKSEGFIEAMANTKRITYMSSDKLKYDRIVGKVYNKNNVHVANLVTVECDKPFALHDPVVFEAICKLMTREISNSEFYQEYGKIYQETLIKNLIDGNFDDRELYASHVAILYDNLKDNLYLAVVDISQCDPDYAKLVYFRDLFRQMQTEYRYAIYSNYILIIISTNNRILDVNKELNELNLLFEQNKMYAGISGRFENLFELRKYYMEALKALKYVLESKSSQRIFPQNINSINAMEQIRSLKNDMGIDSLLNMAYEILGNPVLFHGREFNLLACTENVEIDDPIWREYITYGTVSDKTIEFFINEGFIDAAMNTNSVTFLNSDKLKYDRLFGKICNKDNIVVGNLVILVCKRLIEGDEMALFGAFCRKLSEEVSRIDSYNNYSKTYSETLISKLLNGKINEYDLFSEDIVNFYDTLRDNLYVVVVDITQRNSKFVNLRYLRDLFKKLKTVNRYALYSNYIVIIISSNKPSFNVYEELNEIYKVLELYNIFVGISSRFGNICELQKYYTEAVNTLNNGLKNRGRHGNQWIFPSDETYVDN